MEPFVKVPRECWPELRDLYKQWWPHGVAGFCILDTQYNRPAHKSTGFRIFCPWEDLKNGAVALCNMQGMQQIMILPTTIDVEKLEKALLDTKLIDWSQTLCFPFCDTDAMSVVNRLCPKVNIKQSRTIPTIRLFRSCTTPLYEIDGCPPDTYTGPVTLENLEQVDNVWPHRDETSTAFLKWLIEDNASYGLYSAEDNSLLAWVFIGETGFLTHLYTEETHRGKGYAQFIVKYLSNKEAREGRNVWCHVMEENLNSLNLFRKLEFEVIGRGVWIIASSDCTQSEY